MSFEVLSAAAFKEKGKELKDSYKAAKKDYAALKGEEKKDATKPTMPMLKRVRVVKSRQEAEKLCSQLQEKSKESK